MVRVEGLVDSVIGLICLSVFGGFRCLSFVHCEDVRVLVKDLRLFGILVDMKLYVPFFSSTRSYGCLYDDS